MRRSFARRRATRVPHDYVWVPTVTACNGSNVAGGCNGTPLGIALVTAVDWQNVAGVAFDRATLLRLHLQLLTAFASESSENTIIYGVFSLSQTTVLPNLFLPGTWADFDVLSGPHLEGLQTFAPNPAVLDVKVKRRMTSDTNIVFAIQASDADNIAQIWVVARALVNRLVK